MHRVSVTAGALLSIRRSQRSAHVRVCHLPPVATSRTPPVHVQSASLAVRLPRTWGMTTPQGYQ